MIPPHLFYGTSRFKQLLPDEGDQSFEDEQHVGQFGQHPAAALSQELREALRTVGRITAVVDVLQLPASQHHQRAQPAVFTCRHNGRKCFI